MKSERKKGKIRKEWDGGKRDRRDKWARNKRGGSKLGKKKIELEATEGKS